MAGSREVTIEMERLKDETMAMLRAGKMYPDRIPWPWTRRRDGEMTPDYLGRVLEEAGLSDLAERARLGHFDDFHAPEEVADGAELMRLVAELRIAGRRDPERDGWTRAIENAARHGEFDATRAESERWQAGRQGQETMATVAGAEEEIRAGLDGVVDAIKARMPKVGRNEPCPCGSGLKSKRCHGA